MITSWSGLDAVGIDDGDAEALALEELGGLEGLKQSDAGGDYGDTVGRGLVEHLGAANREGLVVVVDDGVGLGGCAGAAPPKMPRYLFENFTTANGLPDNHVYSVLVDGDRIWAGTDNGSRGFRKRQVERSSPQRTDWHTGQCSRWRWTNAQATCGRARMGGLSRISGGRIDTFTQLNSGLSNDVVYGVSIEGENVWVATAAGACRLNLHTGQWSLYNERNTPMVEIWVYGVSATPTKVYYAVWGSGILEYDQKTKAWDKYEDPDGENEMVLFKDQGLIHEITTSVSYVDNVLWAATYFGDSRYDGRYWHNFLTKDSGLAFELHKLCEGRRRQSCVVLHRQRTGLL